MNSIKKDHLQPQSHPAGISSAFTSAHRGSAEAGQKPPQKTGARQKAFTRRATVPLGAQYAQVITTTSLVFVIVLLFVTLQALYHGLQ